MKIIDNKKLFACIAALTLMSGGMQVAGAADIIPYPTVGTPNPVTYSFTASSTGDVFAYFAGSTASYDNQLGMLINGAPSGSGFGLDNHTSAVGQSFDLGSVNAGDSLVFVLHNLTLSDYAYSDPSLNVAYDVDGSMGHNHVYSTPYTSTPPIDSIPNGTYVAFEDLRFPSSDFNYHDETFVFTNVSTTTNAPEPATLTLLGVAFAGIGWARRRKVK